MTQTQTLTRKSETRAVRIALANVGIEARVRQRHDGVCNWLEISVTDGQLRNPALTVAERVCNRHGYDGIITVSSDN